MTERETEDAALVIAYWKARATAAEDALRSEADVSEPGALLMGALQLRQYGERAPGGDETWHEWERKAERYLQGTVSTDWLDRRCPRCKADPGWQCYDTHEVHAERLADPVGEPDVLCEESYGPDRLTCTKNIGHDGEHGQPERGGCSCDEWGHDWRRTWTGDGLYCERCKART